MTVSSTGTMQTIKTSFIETCAERSVLVLILIIASVLRLFRLGYPSLWLDEIGQALVANRPFPMFWRGVEAHHGAAPLDYLITKGIILLGGQSDFALRLPAALWGVLSVYWSYRLGKRLWSSHAGLLVATLLALHPLHLRYSQELRFYALFIFLSLVSTEVFLIAWEKERRSWWLCYVATALIMLYSHYYGGLTLGLHGLWALIDSFWPNSNDAPNRRPRFIHFLFAAGIAILLFLPWMAYDLPKEKGFARAQPPQLAAKLVQDVVISFSKPIRNAWIAGLLAIGGLVALLRKRRTAALALGFWLFWLLPLILWIDIKFSYFFHIRQILLGLPFFLMLIAGGMAYGVDLSIVAARRRWECVQAWPLHLMGALAIVMTLILFARPSLFPYYTSQDSREDWKGAARLVERNLLPVDKLLYLSYTDRHYFKHYMPPKLWEASQEMTEQEELEAILAEGTAIWVPVSPYVSFTNPAAPDLEAWLKAQGATPFIFNQQFTLYFLSPHQDKAALQARAEQWTAPERLHWWVVVGKAMSQANAHETAIAAFLHAASLPDFRASKAEALTLAGNEALTLERPRQALVYFEQALQIDPTYNQAWMQRVRALLRLGQPQQALTALAKAERLMGGEDYWLAWFRARSYAALGEWDNAIAAYQRTLTLQPHARHIPFFLARAYEQKGDLVQARIWYQTYLEQDPNGPFASQAQAFLASH